MNLGLRPAVHRAAAVATAASTLGGFVVAVGSPNWPMPLAAVALTVLAGPVLLRGARTGRLRPVETAIAAAVLLAIPWTAAAGAGAASADWMTAGWWTAVVLGGALLLRLAGRLRTALACIAGLLLHAVVWAGPEGVLRLGTAEAVVLLLGVLGVLGAVSGVAEAALTAARHEREAATRQAEQDAFHLERQVRLHLAGRNAAPMLQRIIDRRGDLDEGSRAQSRVLEQTIRDEIRGRRLLNDAVRGAVRAHRDRGAVVQMLDDGGLDELTPGALNPLLDELARRLHPLTSSRIVVRTGQRDSATAITLVGTTPDETAAALGLDDDDRVEAWSAIPRPAPQPA